MHRLPCTRVRIILKALLHSREATRLEARQLVTVPLAAMQISGGRFAVRNASPTRMVRLFLGAHAPGLCASVTAASSSGGGSAATAAPAADLVSWVQEAGGSTAGVVVRRDESGFGLAAAQDCGPGATLISLPQRCHLTYDGSTDPRLLALIDQVPAELWGAKLALQVVAHRLLGQASPYAAYVNNLPMGVAGLPIFFNGEALGTLQYPPVTEQVKKRCRWLLSFTQQVLGPLRGTDRDPFEGAEVDANALGWALAVVTSRAFRTRGPGQPASLLPLVDMSNHSFEPNAKVVPGPGGSMHMVALRELHAGEDVLISYGGLSNDFLLLDYGFLVPGNLYDTVQLRFDRGLIEAAKAVAGVGSTGGQADDPTSDELPPLPAWQQRELAALQLAGPDANTEVNIRRVSAQGQAAEAAAGAAAGSPADARLLAALRVLCAPSEAALCGRSGAERLGRWDAPLAAPAAELAALRTLTGLCAIALSQFKGTVEEDIALLAASKAAGQQAQQQGGEQQEQQRQLTPDEELAVRFRMDKKELLLEALAITSRRIKQLAAAASPSGSGGGKAAGGKAAGGSKGKVPASKGGGRGFAKP
ncbi:hypothetical protein ABPG75_000782 [Micractinium tetrahymenae]